MSKEFIFPVRVYYEDTDTEGVVYHANYLKFMDRARSEWCRSFGLELSRLSADGMLLAVRASYLEYLRPAMLDDMLEVVTTVEEISRVKIIFNQVIRSEQNADLIYCKGLITVVSVDRRMRPCRLLPKLLEGVNCDH